MGQRIRQYVKRALAIAIALVAILWSADWLVLQYRIARDRDPFGEVEVRRSFAVHLKNKQVEYRTEKPKMEECVHSIFPHTDESPCWYLARHREQLIELDGGPWHFYNP